MANTNLDFLLNSQLLYMNPILFNKGQSLKRFIKFFLWSLGGIMLVVVASGIIIINLDPNHFKDFIAGKISEKIGRQFEISQGLKIQYYPWLSIEASGIILGNAKGFTEHPFLKADYLKLRIKTLPLLKKQIEMDIVSIKGAQFNLAKNKTGISNWVDLSGSLALGKKADLPELSPSETASKEKELAREENGVDSASLASLAVLMVGGLDIQDASINFDDRASGESYQISNLDITTGSMVRSRPIEFNIAFNTQTSFSDISGDASFNGIIYYDLDAGKYQIKPFRAEVELKEGEGIGENSVILNLASAVYVDLGQGMVTIPELEINMPGATIKGEIRIRGIHSFAPFFTGSLMARGSDLPGLLQVAGQFEGEKSWLALMGKRLEGSENKAFHMETQFDADPGAGRLNIPKFSFKALGITMDTWLAADRMNTLMPSAKGWFKADGSDLSLVVELAGFFQEKDSFLESLGSQLAKVDQKAFHTEVNLDVDLGKGRINVPVLSIAGLGIVLEGNVTALHLGSDKAVIDGKVSLEGKQLSQLTQFFKALEQKDLADILQSISLKAEIKGNLEELQISPLQAKVGLSGKQAGKSLVDLTLGAATRISVNKETLALDSFSLKGLGLDAQGSFHARKIMSSPVYKGRLSLAQFNLRALMKKLNQPLPVTADTSVFKKMAVKTSFSGSAKDVFFKDLALVIDQTSVNGEFAIKNFADPKIGFDLAVDKINVDRYLPGPQNKGKKSKKKDQAKSRKSGKAIPATPETLAAATAIQIPMEKLRAFKVKGKLRVKDLIVSKAHLQKVVASLDADSGNIRFAPLSANLYKGTYTGDMSLNAKGNLPRLTFNSTLKEVEAKPLPMDKQENN
jgi:hypothetical protein